MSPLCEDDLFRFHRSTPLHDTNFDQLQSIVIDCCSILPLYGLVYLSKELNRAGRIH